MTTTLLLVILKTTPWGVCDIPPSEWDKVARLLDDFGASVVVHVHNVAGAFHDFPYVPAPHYAAEIMVDDHKKAQLCAALRPLLDEIVTRNTRYSVVPAGR